MKAIISVTPSQVAIIRSLVTQYKNGISEKRAGIIADCDGFIDDDYLNDHIDDCDDLLSLLPSKDAEKDITYS